MIKIEKILNTPEQKAAIQQQFAQEQQGKGGE